METKSHVSLEQIFSQAESRLKEGLETLGRWSSETRAILDHQPGVVLTSLTIAGFMTGALLRQGGRAEHGSKLPPPLELGMAFAAGTIAGLAFGPAFLRKSSIVPIRPASRDDWH